ncbi:hypothetical protein BABINDRAFT_91160 [Babjeviella inositovora NRRL Y-12698]|uniref:Uncharacterized protein n=1 Tax=Babjeviella inositovora NRRL Y-12698 TaxID=984486 RepID=A0A1E3QK13_9ASCO|nr:uncharacterized protein BABINDRAFT_91160 [Babjeviella inositovora NRRL Y-12698]ODQ77990.1 hypothetical protein BABINDRAFT_91160 [Babjeviella inositovora NRRL Y-12698]
MSFLISKLTSHTSTNGYRYHLGCILILFRPQDLRYQVVCSGQKRPPIVHTPT